jgi:hypothetical protein
MGGLAQAPRGLRRGDDTQVQGVEYFGQYIATSWLRLAILRILRAFSQPVSAETGHARAAANRVVSTGSIRDTQANGGGGLSWQSAI